jgi:hypothetical protein
VAREPHEATRPRGNEANAQEDRRTRQRGARGGQVTGARTRRTSVSSRKSSPTSMLALPTWTTYRRSPPPTGAAGTISTSRSPPASPARARLILQALSDRPSTPFSRAHSPGLIPAAAAARKQARASRSPSTLRPMPPTVAAPVAVVTPAWLSGHAAPRGATGACSPRGTTDTTGSPRARRGVAPPRRAHRGAPRPRPARPRSRGAPRRGGTPPATDRAGAPG